MRNETTDVFDFFLISTGRHFLCPYNLLRSVCSFCTVLRFEHLHV